MKKKRISMLVTCVLVCGIFGGCAPSAADKPEGASTTDQTQQAKASAEKKEAKAVVAEDCLSCHSADEVAAASADYRAESGEVANPHRMIDEKADHPHEATGNEKIADCGKCHTAHESDMPSADDIKLPENVNYCYTKCHHQRTFDACSECHNDK